MSATATMPDDNKRAEDLRSAIKQLPSERDWAVYQAVRIEQWPTRAVAAELGISQARVCQMVQRTATFIALTAPVITKDEEPRQLAAGKQLAADRIDFLYGEALRCFRMSQSPEQADCTKHGSHRYGDVRYLHAAARLAILASTLPPPQQLTYAAVAEQPAANNCPPETCSAPPAEQPETAQADLAPSSATAAVKTVCGEQTARNETNQRATARPVQKQASVRNEAAITPRQGARRQEFLQTG